MQPEHNKQTDKKCTTEAGQQDKHTFNELAKPGRYIVKEAGDRTKTRRWSTNSNDGKTAAVFPTPAGARVDLCVERSQPLIMSRCCNVWVTASRLHCILDRCVRMYA